MSSSHWPTVGASNFSVKHVLAGACRLGDDLVMPGRWRGDDDAVDVVAGEQRIEVVSERDPQLLAPSRPRATSLSHAAASVVSGCLAASAA